jgi:hypothetical protein
VFDRCSCFWLKATVVGLSGTKIGAITAGKQQMVVTVNSVYNEGKDFLYQQPVAKGAKGKPRKVKLETLQKAVIVWSIEEKAWEFNENAMKGTAHGHNLGL